MVCDSTRNRNSEGHKQWLPCRAWDFESLMYPSVFWLKLFGFFPYKYRNNEYVMSKIRLAFATFFACLHLAFLIYMFYAVNFSERNHSITETITDNFFILLDGFIPLLMFLASYSRLVMLQSLTKVSRILSPQDFNDMAKLLHLTHILNFLHHVAYIPLIYRDTHTVSLTERYISLVISMAASEGMLFCLNCVCVLGACFKKVNESLKRLRASSTNDQSELTEEQESRRQRVMLLMKVKYYEDVHDKISDAVDHLNKTSRAVNINFTWITVSGGLPINVYVQFEYFSFVILRISRFVLLVWVCEIAMDHAKEIHTTIHDLANHCRDDAVMRELKYFALQVVHRDNAITTSAFKINGKLLSQVRSSHLLDQS
ncbi:uncharacterized protein LOC143211138 [Lasioglossum baleicum]|uniref:uncharacterized protein LOC143211138 n=1 Tax=Lasioglossum baleicum TaxID=434251 RepID=UPI003FCD5AE2